MTEGNSDVQQCSGIRKHTPRAFDLPCLPLLCFHVHAFFSGGLFTSLEVIPQTICVHESPMHLVVATFFPLVTTVLLCVTKTGSGISMTV